MRGRAGTASDALQAPSYKRPRIQPMGGKGRGGHDLFIATEFSMTSTNGARSPATTPRLSTAQAAAMALEARARLMLRQPWLLCAMVVMVALMSSYVHLVNAQVTRGEQLRQGMAAGKKPAAAPAGWAAEAALPPLSPVAMDTGR